jgi:hypothetical protein
MNSQKSLLNCISLTRTVLSTALLSLLFVASAQADTTNEMTKSIEDALKFGQADAKYGKIDFELRFRYDNTDSDHPTLKTANAATMRMQIGYLTPEFHGLQGYAEYAGVQDIVANDYNSTRNGKTQFETIPDPQQNVLNQLWISYKGLPDTEVKIGRQRFEFDNQRFLSSVDWRQLQQVFDGLLITNTSLPNTTINAGYILKRQSFTATVEGMQMPFANIAYNFADIGKLSSYAYLMDFNENHNASNQTYGVRFDGSRKINDDLKAHYLVEYAYQKEHTQNPTHYRADYYHVVGGVTAFGVTAKAGMEQLGGKGLNRTFDAPIGLVHAFNGWADQFTTTPNNGLRDIYGSLGGEIEGVKLLGMFHEYSDDTGNLDYGREWNFQVTKEFLKHYTLLAKYAYYDAGNVAASTTLGRYDTQKFWIGAGVSF